jgi:hypothetical protein
MHLKFSLLVIQTSRTSIELPLPRPDYTRFDLPPRMSASQPLRRASRTAPTPHARTDARQAPQAPRLFTPPAGDLAPDPAELFDLKAKPGYYNAAAKTALLRRSKKAPHDELFVDFSRPEVHIDLIASDLRLLSGNWTWQAIAAGKPLVSQGPWTEARWHRDDDCDYLEIELSLSQGWKLARQMLLARRDRFFLLADSLISPNADRVEIRHSQSLPLSPIAALAPAHETREAWLVANARRRATIVPPALPEWRSEFRHAELSADKGNLKLEQGALGRSLYAPLWIDLDPKRLRRPLTWRRLTVAENLNIVSRDVAAAYRIQAGREQWLIYHSLAPAANRSVLGLNTLSSFVAARILPNGLTDEILAIE